MKITLSMDFDIPEDSAFGAPDANELQAALMNISMVFQKLRQNIPLQEMRVLTEQTYTPEMREALLENIKEEESFVEQIFHNWTIKGQLDNGMKFVFNHKEPGYKEYLEIL